MIQIELKNNSMKNTNKKNLASYFLIFIIGFYLSMCFAKAASVNDNRALIDRVVAIVDKEVVLASEVERRLVSTIEQINKNQQKAPPVDKLQEQVLQRLVLESLQLQLAKRAGVRVSDADLDKTIENISLDNKMFVDTFRKEIESTGVPWAIFREDVRKEIMIARIRNADVSRRINISENEIENLVQQINKQGESQTQYLLGHILISLKEGASPEELREANLKAEKLVSDLQHGADFEEYAISYSDGQNALGGGNLEWRSLAQLPTLFADTVKDMKAGDISQPVRSGSGLHILQLKETRGGFQTHQVVQTRSRHILIKPNQILDEQAAREKISGIRQRILDGEDFATLAKEFSDDKVSASQGGDLDWAEASAFVPPFTQAMNALEINQLSEPVKTQFGWHIIQVLERRAKDQTEKKKREHAYRILHSRKFEEEAQLWEGQLRDQAYIKIIN